MCSLVNDNNEWRQEILMITFGRLDKLLKKLSAFS